MPGFLMYPGIQQALNYQAIHLHYQAEQHFLNNQDFPELRYQDHFYYLKKM